MFFRKKQVVSKFFGNIVFSRGLWEGRKVFPPMGEEICMYFDSISDGRLEEDRQMWLFMCEKYSWVLQESVESIVAFSKELDSENNPLPPMFNESNLSLEGVGFEENWSLRLYWGVLSWPEGESELEVVTCLKNEQVTVLGFGD